jgi:hypothetical protein
MHFLGHGYNVQVAIKGFVKALPLLFALDDKEKHL